MAWSFPMYDLLYFWAYSAVNISNGQGWSHTGMVLSSSVGVIVLFFHVHMMKYNVPFVISMGKNLCVPVFWWISVYTQLVLFSFSMSSICCTVGVFARCSEDSDTSNLLSTKWGDNPSAVYIALPSNISSTISSTLSLLPYGHISSASGLATNGEVFDIYWFLVLCSTRRQYISFLSDTAVHAVNPLASFVCVRVCLCVCVCVFVCVCVRVGVCVCSGGDNQGGGYVINWIVHMSNLRVFCVWWLIIIGSEVVPIFFANQSILLWSLSDSRVFSAFIDAIFVWKVFICTYIADCPSGTFPIMEAV